jgi:hypothetical protein
MGDILEWLENRQEALEAWRRSAKRLVGVPLGLLMLLISAVLRLSWWVIVGFFSILAFALAYNEVVKVLKAVVNGIWSVLR